MEQALEIVLEHARREAAKRRELMRPYDHLQSREPLNATIHGERAAALREAAEAIKKAIG